MNNFDKKYYQSASGIIQPIDLLRLLPFTLASACKYLLRAEYKGQRASDYAKAADYLSLVLEELGAPQMEQAQRAWHLLLCFRSNEWMVRLYNTGLKREALETLVERLNAMSEGK